MNGNKSLASAFLNKRRLSECWFSNTISKTSKNIMLIPWIHTQKESINLLILAVNSSANCLLERSSMKNQSLNMKSLHQLLGRLIGRLWEKWVQLVLKDNVMQAMLFAQPDSSKASIWFKIRMFFFQSNKSLTALLTILHSDVKVEAETEPWHIFVKRDWHYRVTILTREWRIIVKNKLENTSQFTNTFNSQDALIFKMDFMAVLWQLQSMPLTGKPTEQESSTDVLVLRWIMMFSLLVIMLNGGELKILGERDGENMAILDSKQETLAEFVRSLLLVSLND